MTSRYGARRSQDHGSAPQRPGGKTSPPVTVLQGLTEDFRQNGQSLQTHLDKLSNTRRRGKEPPSYSVVDYRHAHTYYNFMYYAHMVKSYTEESGLLQNFSSRVNVVSLGAGCGADVFGLAWYLRESGARLRLSATLLDKESAWSELWTQITRQARSLSLEGARYLRDTVDLTWVSDDWLGHVQQADVLLLNHTLSELMGDEDAQYSLVNICNNMKPGAMLFVVEQPSPELARYVTELAEDADLSWRFWFENGGRWEDRVPLSEDDREAVDGLGLNTPPRDSGQVSVFTFWKN